MKRSSRVSAHKTAYFWLDIGTISCFSTVFSQHETENWTHRSVKLRHKGTNLQLCRHVHSQHLFWGLLVIFEGNFDFRRRKVLLRVLLRVSRWDCDSEGLTTLLNRDPRRRRPFVKAQKQPPLYLALAKFVQIIENTPGQKECVNIWPWI